MKIRSVGLAGALLLVTSACPSTCAFVFDEGVGVPCDSHSACPEGTYCGDDGTCQAGAAQDAGSVDAARGDTGSHDQTVVDSAGVDAAMTDSSTPDSALADAEEFDAAGLDAFDGDAAGFDGGADTDAQVMDGAVMVDAAAADVSLADLALPDGIIGDAAQPDSVSGDAALDGGVLPDVNTVADSALPDVEFPDLLAPDLGEDAGVGEDVPIEEDASQQEDAGSGEDGAALEDGGLSEDAGGYEDAGGPEDSAVAEDGAIAEDGGVPNFAFVIEDAQTPGLGTIGIAAADGICQTEGDSIPGGTNTYLAFLSTTTEDAPDRLGSARGWVRVDGRPFVDTVADLRGGKIFHPLAVTENGTFLGNVLVSTGTNGNGDVATTRTCADWSSTINYARAGTTSGTSVAWTHKGDQACNGPSRFYCFGVDRQVEVAPVSGGHRKAFITNTGFQPGTGKTIFDADNLCDTQASGAGLTGTFLAMMCQDGVSAQERFSGDTSPWERTDGVRVAATAAALFEDLYIDAPINVSANGAGYISSTPVWSGCSSGLDSPGTAQSTCNNWGDSSLTQGRYGMSEYANPSRYNWTTSSCSSSWRVICLEE